MTSSERLGWWVWGWMTAILFSVFTQDMADGFEHVGLNAIVFLTILLVCFFSVYNYNRLVGKDPDE